MTARRRHHLGLALAAPALVVPGTMSAPPAAHAYTAPSPPTRTLPTALDVFVPYQGQTVCDPVARPGVISFAKLMTSHYGMGSTALIGRTCTGSVSEHYDGRAWDWMLDVGDTEEGAVARSVLAWLTRTDANGTPGAMARRFGIMYIIYDHKMWRAYAPERGWAPYYGSNPHTDHIHFSFNYDGAAGRTSWWTGVATKTYLTSLPPSGGVITVPSTPTALSYGMQSEAVRQLQVRLGNLPTTGYYGDQTKARVIEYQRFAGLPQTGTADLRTQEILARRGWRTVAAAFPTLSTGMTSTAVKTLQTKLGSLPTTGYYGSMTRARVTAYQKFAGLPQTGTADPVTQYRLWVRGWTAASTTPTPTTPTPTTPTSYPTLSFGMTSTAVKNLQARLGSLPTTGYYGSMTKARVIAYQKAVALRATGIADNLTQQLLYAKGWPKTYAPLSYGMTSTAVKDLQARLGSVPTTGYFGSLTRARVIAYQKHVGLEPTGIADNRTRQLLVTRGWSTVTLASHTTSSSSTPQEGHAMTALAHQQAEVTRLDPAVSTVSTTTSLTAHKDTVLGMGTRGAAVRALQRALGGLAVDGVFGSVTRDKVVALQRSLVMETTGIVTPEMWDVLEARAYPFVTQRTTVLRAGDSGPMVAAVQRLLGVRVTGTYDDATRDAVKRAQAKAGLASTGVVASRTWSLFDSLSA